MGNEVLILCQYFYPEHVSSAILPSQLGEYLVENKYPVNVICGWPQEYFEGFHVAKKEVYKGMHIHRLKYGKFNNKKKFGRMINFFSFFLATFFRISEISKNSLIMVYSNPPILPYVGYLAKKISRAKLVFVGFDLYPDNAIAVGAIRKDGLICKIMRFINERIYKKADLVIAISEDMKEYMLKTHKELDENRALVIPNWYTGEIEHTNQIMNDEFRQLRDNFSLILLYTGNMGEAQELDTILDSIIKMKEMDQYNHVLFVFTGHGSRKTEIELILKDHGVLNTRFYGFLKGQDYKDMLNIADVCLVSLKKGIEGLGVPSKVYGYYAYGKPVISIMSDETEMAKNITRYNAGFNIEQSDVTAFIDAVDVFLGHGNLIQKMGANSLKIHNELYNKTISLQKYKAAISDLMKIKENTDV